MNGVVSALDRLGVRLYQRLLLRPARHPWAWPEGGDAPAQWEAVRFDRPDGYTVAGLWGRAAGAPRGVVVCAHPFKRTGKGYFLEHGHGSALRRAGYHVLLFDFGGFGETRQQSVLFPRDVLAAGAEAVRRAPGLPVGLLGVCFGGVYGTCAMSTPGHPFRAAVLDGPFTSVAGAVRGMAELAEAPLSRSQRAQSLLFRLTDPLLSGLDPLRQAARATGLRRVLLIAGRADTFSPELGVRRYAPAFRRAGVPCDVWSVSGAEHLGAFNADPAAYARRVVAFFDCHLTGGVRRPAARRPTWPRAYGRRRVGSSGSGR